MCYVVLYVACPSLVCVAVSRVSSARWMSDLARCRFRADSRFAPSQWETALLCNDVSHWLGASIESAPKFIWCHMFSFIAYTAFCIIFHYLSHTRPRLMFFVFSCDINSSTPSAAYVASVNWVSIGSGNGLSPVRRHAITWTNAGLMSIRPLGTIFSEIQIKITKFSFMKMHLNVSSAKWRPFCPGGDELNKNVSYSSISYLNEIITTFRIIL